MVKMVNGSGYYRALESVSIASALSSVLTIYPCQRSESINADSSNSNFLQLGRSGGRPQRTVYPTRLPVNTVIHTTLADFEPTIFRLLVRRATSSASAPTHHSYISSNILVILHLHAIQAGARQNILNCYFDYIFFVTTTSKSIFDRAHSTF